MYIAGFLRFGRRNITWKNAEGGLLFPILRFDKSFMIKTPNFPACHHGRHLRFDRRMIKNI